MAQSEKPVVVNPHLTPLEGRGIVLALCVDGESGIGVNADAILERQRAAVFQYQLYVFVDDDALAIGEAGVQHMPTCIEVVLVAVFQQRAGERGRVSGGAAISA